MSATLDDYVRLGFPDWILINSTKAGSRGEAFSKYGMVRHGRTYRNTNVCCPWGDDSGIYLCDTGGDLQTSAKKEMTMKEIIGLTVWALWAIYVIWGAWRLFTYYRMSRIHPPMNVDSSLFKNCVDCRSLWKRIIIEVRVGALLLLAQTMRGYGHDDKLTAKGYYDPRTGILYVIWTRPDLETAPRKSDMEAV